MSPGKNVVGPSRIAVRLVTLFAPAGEEESIVGDLLEEFSQLASSSGISCARRWYWRQTLKTIPAFLIAGFRSAPGKITAVVVNGFLLRWVVSWWSNPAINRAIEAILERYQVYEHSPQIYIFLLTHIMLLERFLVNLLIGAVVAFTAKGREMTTALMLGLISDGLAVQAVWMGVARTGDQGLLWTLPWSFAFSLAVFMGAALVRIYGGWKTTRRLAK